jgi:hypothetical protein
MHTGDVSILVGVAGDALVAQQDLAGLTFILSQQVKQILWWLIEVQDQCVLD